MEEWVQEEALRSLEAPFTLFTCFREASQSSSLTSSPTLFLCSDQQQPAASGASWLPVTQNMLSQAKALTLALLQSTFKSGGSQDS